PMILFLEHLDMDNGVLVLEPAIRDFDRQVNRVAGANDQRYRRIIAFIEEAPRSVEKAEGEKYRKSALARPQSSRLIGYADDDFLCIWTIPPQRAIDQAQRRTVSCGIKGLGHRECTDLCRVYKRTAIL